MSLDDHGLRRLHAEFEGVRNAYKQTALAIRADPANQELRARLKKLGERHARLRYRIENPSAAAPAPASTKTPNVASSEMGSDLPTVNFQIPESNIPPPVMVAGDDQGAGETLRTGLKWFRLIASGVVLMVLVGVLALISRQDLGFYEVPSSSMEPALKPGDRFVAFVASSYARGDVVVAQDPADPDAYIVKRIVATGGDWVSVRNGDLYVNDTVVPEPYLLESRMHYDMDRLLIDRDSVFLLGDDRNGSEDGHVWQRGVPLTTIMGRVRYIYKPAARRGGFESNARFFSHVP